MPKNMFQRPVPVTHAHNVPRHGAAVPGKKQEVPKALKPQPEAPATLPPLAALLAKTRQ